jgi:hypothetical protein
MMTEQAAQAIEPGYRADPEAWARIRALIAELRGAVESPANQERGRYRPAASFALEEPIASATIYGCDVNGGIRGIHSCGNQAPVQRYLLQIASLRNFEVSPWTDLGHTLANLPPDRSLGISLHPNEVLFGTAEQMEGRLRTIMAACAGRRYSAGTSGLTPILDTTQAYIRQIRIWTETARRVLAPIRQPLPAD